MKAIILCGGQGTRLREETEFRPKPMVEVGRLGYRSQFIKEYFLNYEAMNNDFTIGLGSRKEVEYHGQHEESDFRVTLADTGQETMTGGRIQRVRQYVDDQTFLVTYGDGLSDVDITKLLAFHKSHGKLATVTTVRYVSRFGLLEVDADRQVTAFAEKPKLDTWVNAGYFVFERGVFDYLEGDECILERRPFERLAAASQLMAYRHDGFFFAMDTYRDYQQLNQLWDSGEAPWKIWK